jgi:hypothetical protein
MDNNAKKDITEINVRKLIVGNIYKRAAEEEATLQWKGIVSNVFPDPTNPYAFRVNTVDGRRFRVHIKEVTDKEA